MINDIDYDKMTDLEEIIKGGKLKELEKYIEKHDDYDSLDKALQLSAKYGHLDFVQYLVDCGADINEGLHYAAKYDHLSIVKYCIENEGHNTVGLLYASKYNRTKIIKYFLKKYGVQIILELSLKNGYLGAIKYLIKHDYDFDNYDALQKCIEYGHLPIIKYLFHQVDPEDFKDLFFYAVDFGHVDIIKFFIENIYYDKEDYMDNVDYCVRFGYEKTTYYLIKYDFLNNECINLTEYLRLIIDYGHHESVKFLIRKGADIHFDNEYCFRISVEYGHFDNVKYLIKKKACITVFDNYMLQKCARLNHVEILKYLLPMYTQYQIKVSIKNDKRNDFLNFLLKNDASEYPTLVNGLREIGIDIYDMIDKEM